jgi:AmmeMemoRadiSam system protein B
MSAPLPKLRAGLAEMEDPRDRRFVLVSDPYRLTDQYLRVPRGVHAWLRMFDGRSTLAEIQARISLFLNGRPVPISEIEQIATVLDTAGFLENDVYRQKLNQPDRPPSCIGCYHADPTKLRQQLRELFTAPDGPGLPGELGCRIADEGAVSAVLVPHMDYARGNVTYGWGFKELVERTDATLFVIVATSHYSRERFTLTRQNFVTPLGRAETDQKFVDALVREYGDGLFDDPLAHFPEHSIELEVVLLQYLIEGRRDFRIVPLLVGSFGDCVSRNRLPSTAFDIGRMVAALRKVASATEEKICFIISGDLAHIGPKFDDPDPVDEAQLEHSLKRDRLIAEALNGASPERYFRTIAEEGDERRICGLPPTYLVLESLKPKWGKTLHYGRYVHPEGFESVSFAAAAFGT